MSPVLLAVLVVCTSQAESPPPAEAPAEQPVSQVVSVELVPDQPLEVPVLGAQVTLIDARTTLHAGADGRKEHRSQGTLVFQVGDQRDELSFGPDGMGLEWQGHRITVRGSRGWYELLIRPPESE